MHCWAIDHVVAAFLLTISRTSHHETNLKSILCVSTDAETHQERAERVARLAEKQKDSTQAKVVRDRAAFTTLLHARPFSIRIAALLLSSSRGF